MQKNGLRKCGRSSIATLKPRNKKFARSMDEMAKTMSKKKNDTKAMRIMSLKIYREQDMTVSSVLGGGPTLSVIDVKFSDVTLSMSLKDASQLAEDIRREIGSIYRAELEAKTPLTVSQKLALQPGDRVVVRMDDGEDVAYDVKYSPWQLEHGAWVIGLCGISGGYALDRVVGLIRKGDSK